MNTELTKNIALFGSVLRDDFRPDSDIDCLVKFSNNAHWTLLHIGKMEDELKDIFQRDVDLVIGCLKRIVLKKIERLD